MGLVQRMLLVCIPVLRSPAARRRPVWPMRREVMPMPPVRCRKALRRKASIKLAVAVSFTDGGGAALDRTMKVTVRR